MEQSTRTSRSGDAALRVGFVILLIACAVGAVVNYVRDQQRRAAVDAFVVEFKVAERRPAHAETIANAPSADVAAEVAADVAVQDATGTIDIAEVEPETHDLWMAIVSDLDRELRAASQLVVPSIRARPGWAYNRNILGAVEYALARRNVALAKDHERWLRPLELAMIAAPGDRGVAAFTGSALVEAWPYLASFDAVRARTIWGAAFNEPRFVSESYLSVVDALNHEAAFALLPPFAPSLRAAWTAESDVGDTDAAALLYPKWEKAELRERAEDLHEMQRLAALDDRTGVLRAATAWAARHDLFEFDTPPGRTQATSVIELWPAEPGVWPGDRRSAFIRFFLDRPAERATGHAVAAAAMSLSNVPAAVRARAAIMSGDEYTADTLLRASESSAGFEWTPYYVDLAMHHLAARRVDAADETLRRVAPAAEEECDVSVARQAIALARGNTQLLDARHAPAVYPADMWSQARVAVCIDPLQRFSALAVSFRAEYPTLVAYGFDGGRMATTLIPAGSSRLRLPLHDRGGRHVFSYRVVSGGDLTAESATLVR